MKKLLLLLLVPMVSLGQNSIEDNIDHFKELVTERAYGGSPKSFFKGYWIDTSGILRLAETTFGIPIFNSGPHTKEYFNSNCLCENFGHYNPLFLDNAIELVQTLSPLQKALIQPIYDKYFKIPIRTLMVNQMFAFFEDLSVFKGEDSNHIEYNFLEPIISREDHNSVLETIKTKVSYIPSETLFWIRRHYDGTSDKFLQLFEVIMEEFDGGNISTEMATVYRALAMDPDEAFDVLMNNEIKEFQYPVKTFTSKSVKERLISGEIPVVEDPVDPLTYNGALYSGLAKRKITSYNDLSLNESLTINSFYGGNNSHIDNNGTYYIYSEGLVETIINVSKTESYEDYLYSFSHKKKSSTYLHKMHYYPNIYMSNGNDLNKLIKEVYLNGNLIQEEVGNTIYKYDSSGNVEEKAYFKSGNLAELFNNDEIFELKLNSGRILKNRKTTETFFDENGSVKLKYEFLQAVNYAFYQYCKCCPTLENYTSKSNRRRIDAIDYEWQNSDCSERWQVPYKPVISDKKETFYFNGLPKSKELILLKPANNMNQLNKISYSSDGKLMEYYNSEDINFPEENQLRFRIDYNQNQVKSYKVSNNIDLSEIYFVNAKSGLNVRDNNSLDGNKINKLPYGSLVYLAKENQGELAVTDTDPITGEKKIIFGNWVELVSMNYEPTFFNENIANGYAFDAFLTKVKTDSFDYFKFLETENRVLYSELEEGEAYLYKEQKYTGLAISFYDNGQLAFAASYKDGKLNGWWRKWEENGFLFLETEYVDGEMVSEIDFN